MDYRLSEVIAIVSDSYTTDFFIIFFLYTYLQSLIDLRVEFITAR